MTSFVGRPNNTYNDLYGNGSKGLCKITHASVSSSLSAECNFSTPSYLFTDYVNVSSIKGRKLAYDGSSSSNTQFDLTMNNSYCCRSDIKNNSSRNTCSIICYPGQHIENIVHSYDEKHDSSISRSVKNTKNYFAIGEHDTRKVVSSVLNVMPSQSTVCDNPSINQKINPFQEWPNHVRNEYNCTIVNPKNTIKNNMESSYVNALRKNSSVFLHVYDLDANVSQFVNTIFRSLGTGFFHAGVEVYGAEYCFGQAIGRVTGITRNIPTRHSVHVYRESIYMGETILKEHELNCLVECLKIKWIGASYNILTRNCLNFADHFCNLLGVGSIPFWVMSLQLHVMQAAHNLACVANILQNLRNSSGVFRLLNYFANLFPFNDEFEEKDDFVKVEN